MWLPHALCIKNMRMFLGMEIGMRLQKYFDHTILKPDATKEEVIKICEEAKEYGFASVCVNEYYTELVKKELEGTDVAVCVVVGFPLGASESSVKAFETTRAVEKGADEIDMVINIGALKDKDYDTVKKDIQAVREACKGKILKVIIETCLLDNSEKEKACELAVSAGADFVKTSTGFSTQGALLEDVALMKRVIGDKAKVKAVGGIKDLNMAKAMIDAGADRIGTSSGAKIVRKYLHQ